MFERIKVRFGAGMKLVGWAVCHRVVYGALGLVYGAGMAGVIGKEVAEAAVCGLYLLLCVRG